MKPIFKSRVLLFLLLFFVNSLCFSSPSLLAEDQNPLSIQLHVEDVPNETTKSVPLAISIHLEKGWHAYWKNPGAAGVPLQFSWNLPNGWEIVDMQWPTPILFGSEESRGYGYEEDFTLIAHLQKTDPLASPLKEISVDARFVVCSEEMCLPGMEEVRLNLDKKTEGSLEVFSKARANLPEKGARITVERKQGILSLRLHKEGQETSPEKIHFFPEKNEKIDNSHPLIAKVENEDLVFVIKEKESLEKLEGVLAYTEIKEGKPYSRSFEIATSIDDDTYLLAELGEEESAQLAERSFYQTFLLTLFFAFLGGLILNLMPCVLPVLSLKVLGFAQMAKESRKRSLWHALLFALGVLVSFWVLASSLLVLQFYGSSVGWGFQLQQPLFVAFMILLLFGFALSLFGLFEMGTSITAKAGSLQQTEASSMGSFFNGVLACAVATPCTGPFLGSAVGFAVTLPPLFSLMIFTSLGLGMAMPYLVLGAFPQLFRFFPKPGNWMITLKEVTGLCMVATCIWLLWVFSAQTGTSAVIFLLASLFLLSIACWIFGKWGSPIQPKKTRIKGWIIAGVFAIFSLGIAWTSSLLPKDSVVESSEIASIDGWEPFSKEKLATLRAKGTPVFIDFTSKWCLICQANHAVLSLSSVSNKLQEAGVVKMLADWTSADPVITAELKKFGRNSVPLYLFYGKEEEPTILPQLLTPDTVIAEIEKL